MQLTSATTERQILQLTPAHSQTIGWDNHICRHFEWTIPYSFVHPHMKNLASRSWASVYLFILAVFWKSSFATDRIRGDLEVGILHVDWKTSGYTLYTCIYPAPHCWEGWNPTEPESQKKTHLIVFFFLNQKRYCCTTLNSSEFTSH